MPTPHPNASTILSATPGPKEAAAARAMERLETLHRLCRSRRLIENPGTPGLLEATLNMREVRAVFDDEDLAKRYPPILTYAQTAQLLQVSINTLKGWFSQGKYPKCVRRGNPGRVLRDAFVQQFLRDEFGINDE